jgi:ABC-type branched-subunit amino acid transport system substrate-binding protein
MVERRFTSHAPRPAAVAVIVTVTAVLLYAGPPFGAAAVDCPAGGATPMLSHNNSVYDATSNSGVPTAGPKLPALSSRPMRTYGAVGSCVGGAADGFDGGEIVVGATIPLRGPQATQPYAKIMRYTAEIFLDWLNLERPIPDQNLTGGLMVGGKRYSMRFAWTGDGQLASEASASIAHSIRRENAHFAWGGYGSTMSRLQAEQTELDGVLLMASIAAAPNVFAGRGLTFGALPPDYTYIQNAVRAVAQAATGAGAIPAVGLLKVGLVYMSPLDGMCAPITRLAQTLGMTVAEDWLAENGLERFPSESLVDVVLRRLQADGVNFVVGCVYHDGGEAVIEGLERLDFTPHAAAFTSTVDISAYQNRVGAGWWQGEYALGVSPWHSSLIHQGDFSGMTSAEYLRRYQTRYGENPSYHGPVSFSAACALGAAIEAAGSLDAIDVAASLRELSLQELGFYSRMTFAGSDGQNGPEMLVLQFPPGEEDLKIVYPRAVPGSISVHFPTPPWGKRRCIALGSGAVYGGQMPDDIPTSECSGHGTCELAHARGTGHEVYECTCDSGWLGNNCDLVWQIGNISVALLFPRIGDSRAAYQLAAAQLAIECINEGDLLPHHNLEAIEIDTALLRELKGSVFEYTQVDQIGQLLDLGRVATAVGAGYSSDVVALAPVLGDTLLLSPSASAATLSNSSAFPTFGRLVMPDDQQSIALADVVQYGHGQLGWKKVGIVQCDDLYCSDLAQGTREQLANHGITDVTELGTIRVTTGEVVHADNIRSSLAAVRQWLQDCNGVPEDVVAVVLLLAHDTEGQILLEMAAEEDLPTSWLCSEAIGSASLRAAAAQSGVIALAPGGLDPSHELYTTLAAQLPEAAGHPFALRAFDAVYVIAHAIRALLDGGGSVDNVTAATALARSARVVAFQGASGDVRLDEKLDRVGSYDIMQFKRAQVNGSSVAQAARIGEWNAEGRSIALRLDGNPFVRVCGASEEDGPDNVFNLWYFWLSGVILAVVVCSLVAFGYHYLRLKRRSSITAFISHSKRDGGDLAGQLKEQLDKSLLGTCTTRGRNFLDVSSDGFGGNDRIDATTIVSAVKRTRCFVLILTGTVLERPFCLVEIYVAISAGIPIVPIVLIKQNKEEQYQFESVKGHLEGLAKNPKMKSSWEQYGLNNKDSIKTATRAEIKSMAPEEALETFETPDGGPLTLQVGHHQLHPRGSRDDSPPFDAAAIFHPNMRHP